jgi:hypothetical protein
MVTGELGLLAPPRATNEVAERYIIRKDSRRSL